MEKRSIAVFDFDGTLTHKDTFVVFAIYVLGFWKFILKVLLCSPWLVSYKLRFYSNGKAKERLFSLCFKGMKWQNFEECGNAFSSAHTTLLREDAVGALEEHLLKGHRVYIVTASMEEWVRPLLLRYPSLSFITTRPEVVDGRLTGNFATENCYGKEKVRRFLEQEPLRGGYVLYAYGDSAGDKALLSMADKSYYRMFPLPS